MGRGRERKTDKAAESVKSTGDGEDQRQPEPRAQPSAEVVAVGRQSSLSDAASVQRGTCSPALTITTCPPPSASRTCTALRGGSLSPHRDGAGVATLCCGEDESSDTKASAARLWQTVPV